MLLTAELISGLTRAFPFYLVFGEALRLVHVAPRYERLTTTIRVGAILSEVTRLERPATAFTFAKLLENEDLDFVLRSVEVPQLQVHGRLIRLEASAQIVFLGTPWVSTLAEIADAGMSLADFPTHDILLTLITTMHAKDVAMADAQRLASELRVERRSAQARNTTNGTSAADSEPSVALGRVIASMAHEISTPLGVARIALSLLGEQNEALAAQLVDGSLTRQSLKHFLEETAAASALLAANLSRTADLVGNFRLIAVDRRSEQRRTVRLVPFVEDVLQQLAPLLERAGVRVDVDGDRMFADHVYPVAFARLVTMLVENALMHAYDGVVEPRLRVTISTVGDDCLLLCEDNGVGIDASNLVRVFEPFFSTRRMSGGIGLGLYIAHNIAHELLSGGIRAESISPHGCRIVVRWPATRVIDP